VLLPLEIVEPHRARFRRDRKEFEARGRALFAKVGLAGAETRYPWQLSGGMQQRVSLCRALIHDPALLLLDEPFAALDAFTREELWETLQTLWLDRSFTVLLVTHDLVESVFLADTVHVVSSRPGRIIFSKRVTLPRPRRPEDRYAPEFVDLVHELRDHIGRAREETR
jgi:NitT/TauT family transport system ATP-binding protein